MNCWKSTSWLSCSLLALAFFAPANVVNAGIIVPGTEQVHLDFANDPIFQSVGWVSGFNSGGVFIAGSGVLISPEWVLSAAHVLDNGWDSVAFSFDTQATGSGNMHHADAWYLYPGFIDDGGAGTVDDIALIHLSVPVLEVAPAVIYRGEVEVGTHAYWSGYGRLGYFPTGEISPSGTKRAGENIVDEIGIPVLGIESQFFLADYGHALGSTSLALEMAGSNGDSGGGWFGYIDNQPQLIGITTFSAGLYNTGAIRPAVYQNWIDSYVWPVPEPSTALLLMFAVPFVRMRSSIVRRNE